MFEGEIDEEEYQEFLCWKNRADSDRLTNEESSGESGNGQKSPTDQPDALDMEDASGSVDQTSMEADDATAADAQPIQLVSSDFLAKGGKGKKSTEASKIFHVSVSHIL